MLEAILDWLDDKPSLRERVEVLEAFMATYAEALAELDAATTEAGNQIADLRARIVAGDTEAAEKLLPIVARLHAMAADENAVDPDPENSAGQEV